MKALRRTLRAPGLILLIVTIQLALAAWLSAGIRSAVGSSLGPFAALTDGHFLFYALELMEANPGILAAYQSLLVGSSAFALVLWTLLAPAIILRLRAKNPPSRIAATALRGLPGVTVTTLWCHLFRLILLLATGFATVKAMPNGDWGLVGLASTAIGLAYSTCALDLARCRVMLRGARPFHASTAVSAYREAWRKPAVLLPSMLLSFARWTCTATMLIMAINSAEGPSPIWIIRLLAILAIVLGLTRVAVAVEATGR